MAKKNPGGKQANTKGPKGSFSRGASPVSGKQPSDDGGFFSNLFGGGGGNGSNRMPNGSRMDTITKSMGTKTAPNYGQQNLGMAASGTPGLADKLALNQAAMAAASQPDGIMGILGNFVPGMTAVNAARGAMKHMRPASAFPPRFGSDGQMTPYGMQMQQNSQLLAQQMANQGNDGGDYAPPVPDVPDATTMPSTMPSVKPAWWPAYLPWPPAPDSPMGELAASGYSPSIGAPQNGMNNTQNPMMMGIGGLLRRP